MRRFLRDGERPAGGSLQKMQLARAAKLKGSAPVYAFATCFSVERKVITKHITKVYPVGGLDPEATGAKIAQVRRAGTMEVAGQNEHSETSLYAKISDTCPMRRDPTLLGNGAPVPEFAVSGILVAPVSPACASVLNSQRREQAANER